MGDTALILGQRLGEWCGHGPVLEQDIALTNMALDHIGQARLWLQLAAHWKGAGTTEDTLAFFRTEREYLNPHLVELPNGDWAVTVMRLFLYDTFNYFLQDRLRKSAQTNFREIGEKSFKEVAYHAQWSAEWVIRLGDGTEESRNRILAALEQLWPYTGELFVTDEAEAQLLAAGECPDYTEIRERWNEKVKQVLEVATLPVPQDTWQQGGGKQGLHTEHMGYLLAEMQHLPRMYPDARW